MRTPYCRTGAWRACNGGLWGVPKLGRGGEARRPSAECRGRKGRSEDAEVESSFSCALSAKSFSSSAVACLFERTPLRLKPLRVEGVAGLHAAGLVALHEPAHALGAGAVREAVGHGVALAALLQRVV